MKAYTVKNGSPTVSIEGTKEELKRAFEKFLQDASSGNDFMEFHCTIMKTPEIPVAPRAYHPQIDINDWSITPATPNTAPHTGDWRTYPTTGKGANIYCEYELEH